MVDYFRIPMAGFFAIAVALCIVAPLCLFWPLVMRIGPIYLFGPYVAFLLWLTVIVLAVRVYRWRGLWLMTTAIIVVPATYLHWGLVWACALYGKCL